jgi:hypothetical protein
VPGGSGQQSSTATTQTATSTGACYDPAGHEVSCQGANGGSWNGSCWETVVSSGPSDPANTVAGGLDLWTTFAGGQSSGYIIHCATGGGPGFYVWRASPEPPPTVQELADAAYLLLAGQVVAPDIGVFPGDLLERDAAAMGIVGVPTWFWAKDAGPGVGWEETRTTSVRGYSLRATAWLEWTAWEASDGFYTTCLLGNEPVGVHEPAWPPDGCGHVFAARGDYTITVTAHVRVDWAGAGRSGVIPLSVTRSGTYHVGEVQVVGAT